ncbi:translational GTPase TypA [Candidatus Parcubacteria bacterium]|nr:MAG: translational GTPase TypA [Candidatus Parcubacteria bacterium]
MPELQKIRNIAIIAHVDHGKTTLVDAILKQTHAVDSETAGKLIMDSLDLERERGITIRAKNASVVYQGVKINIVDTPGHADFGGEVERTLRMVDGVILLVDAKEGPMPQTKFVLKKALELGLKAVVVINKIDRRDAQIEEVINRTFDLFVDLGADHEQLEFPIVYASALHGTASLSAAEPGKNINPLLDKILEFFPAPQGDPNATLQILILAIAYDNYKGKMGIGKITAGLLKKGQEAALISADGAMTKSRVTEILVYQGLEKTSVEQAAVGEIVAVAGFEKINIGETITDPDNPKPLPPVAIDEPTMQMTFGANTSPFVGQEGKLVTSRNIQERLYKELETNVALRVAPGLTSDQFLVSGRGELHLSILIETMRREGFELQIGQPKVITKTLDGKTLEPWELLSIRVAEAYQGEVISEVGKRRGELKHMQTEADKTVRLEYLTPTRGLLGLKSLLLTKTRGTLIMHHVFENFRPAVPELNPFPHGSLIATETGKSNAYGLEIAQGRGELFIGPGEPVYQGMVVGQNSRDEDIEVNVCKAKRLSNMRASGSDEAIQLAPPKEITLEFALEYISADELVEVTPQSIRIRKKLLNSADRRRQARQKI